MNRLRCLRPVSACLALLWLAACANGYNPALQRAQAKLAAMQQDPLVVEYAPRALADAAAALSKAERAQAEDADAVQVSHLAYLAEVRAEIARNRARQARAEQTLQDVRQPVPPRSKARPGSDGAGLERLRRELSELDPRNTQQGTVFTLDEVQFDFDRETLKPQADYLMARLVDFLSRHPRYRVTIGGYTDDQGSQAYNRDLSVQRARAVESALVRSGVDPARLTVRGYGAAGPAAGDGSRNRRVEIVLTDQPRLIR